MRSWTSWIGCLTAALLVPLVAVADERPNVVILLADVHGEEAARFIRERDPARPFFLYVPFLAPHSPMEAPKELVAKYAGRSDPTERLYAAMVDSMDQAIGVILDTLESEGLAERTIVVFLSDNGGPLMSGARNTPLRGGKMTTFVSAAHPERVADLAVRIRAWRALHPVAGQRVEIAPHPGWRSPRDWASALLPADETILETGQIYQRQERVLENLQKGYGDRGRVAVD